MISASAMFQRSQSKGLSAKQRRERDAAKKQRQMEDPADLTAEEDYVRASPAEDDYFSSPERESGSSVAFKNVSVVTPKGEKSRENSCSEAPFEYMFCHFEPETGVVENAGCMRLHHKCLVRKVCARSFVVQSAPCTVLNCNHWQVWDGSTDVLVCRCGMGPLQFC